MRALTALLIGVAVLHAQETEQQPKPVFRAGVELVQLDVVVLDERGSPVRGLKRDDFTLLDRGEPLQIVEVGEIAHERPAEPVGPEGVPLDVASNQTANSDRLVIVVLDDLHFRGRDEEAKALVKGVVKELGDGASMALVTTSGIVGVEVTEDRTRLLMAVDRFFDRFDPNHPAFSGGSGAGPANLGGMFGDLGAFRFVGNVAKMIDADDGRRKALVWITSGVRNAHLVSAAISRSAAVVKPPKGIPDPCDGEEYYCTELAGMLSKLRETGVTVYGVSPGGPLDAGRSIAGIASETGGFAVPGDNLAGLRRIIADLDNYYMLGFYPRNPKDRSFHLVEVLVNRPGVRVRARSGYQTGRTPAPPKNRTELTRLAGPVMPATDLPLRLHAVPFFVRGPELALHVTMEVDLGTLPGADASGEITETIEFAAFAVDLKKKKATRSSERRVQVMWPREGVSQSDKPAFMLQTLLSVPPGAYQLRASATAARSKRKGSVYLFVDVPAMASDAVTISGLALSSAASSITAPRVVEARSPPGVTLPFAPGLARTFGTGDTLDVFFQVHRRSSRGIVEGVVALVDERAVEHAVSPWRVEAAASEVRLRVSTSQLTPGPYRLVVRVPQNGLGPARDLGLRIIR